MGLRWGLKGGAVRIGADLMLVVLSTIVGMLCSELAYRAWRDPRWLVHWPNLIAQNRRPQPGVHNRYDGVLGYLATANVQSANENTDSNGFRISLPPPSSSSQPFPGPVLAVGDSFTYGMEVGDNETWPAYLQQQTGWRTINAGVKGFSFDQSVLYAERLAHDFPSSVIVVSFITDDLRRSEMSRLWNIPKPYFDLVGGEAVLRDVPVPHGDRDVLPLWERALGWSLLAEKVWPVLQDIADEKFGYRQRALPKGTGEAVACALTRRLAAIGLPVLLVAQYDPRPWTEPDQDRGGQHRQARHVLRCAQDAHLLTLDTFDALDELVRTQGRAIAYGNAPQIHHNGFGNQLVAELIAETLTKALLAPVATREAPAGTGGSAVRHRLLARDSRDGE